MEFADSARKHGISDADILHAIDSAMVHAEQSCDDESRMMILGPDTSGRVLEVAATPSRDPERVIHADVMRPKFYRLLWRERKHS